jgi:hypothetical protein
VSDITPALRAIIAAELLATCMAEPTAPHASRTIGGRASAVTLTRAKCTAGWRWGLTIEAAEPIPPHEADLWAAAVGAPSTDWWRTHEGRRWHCEWTEAR